MKRLLLLVAVALVGGWIVRTYLIEGVWVASGSMEPTLAVGTHYFVNRMVYHLHSPLRGDIIVFKSPVNAEKGLIKRVIAVGGDQVEIRSKQVFLNNAPLNEPYAVYKRARERLIGDTIPLMKVPEGDYFVLGDNRDESEDSTGWRDPETHKPVYFIHDQNIEGRLMIP